jgi:hypothetical protein
VEFKGLLETSKPLKIPAIHLKKAAAKTNLGKEGEVARMTPQWMPRP